MLFMEGVFDIRFIKALHLGDLKCPFKLAKETPCIMSVQYTGDLQYSEGNSVDWEDIIEYTGGSPVHQGI